MKNVSDNGKQTERKKKLANKTAELWKICLYSIKSQELLKCRTVFSFSSIRPLALVHQLNDAIFDWQFYC